MLSTGKHQTPLDSARPANSIFPDFLSDDRLDRQRSYCRRNHPADHTSTMCPLDVVLCTAEALLFLHALMVCPSTQLDRTRFEHSVKEVVK